MSEQKEESPTELRTSSFLSALDSEDLRKICDGLQSFISKSNDVQMKKDEFCLLLSTILSKGKREDYAELFDLVDISREEFINWDRFSTYIFLDYYEREEKMKTKEIPQWSDVKHIPLPHRTSICKIILTNLSYRYCTVSRDGMICLMDRNFKMIRSCQICTNPEEIRRKDLWITDAAIMLNINKIAFSTTSKEILIYDLACKTDFVCNFKLRGLPYIPLCVTYWADPHNPNHAILAFGDANGVVHVLTFKAATISLFDKPLTVDSDQLLCFEVNINELSLRKYPSVFYIYYAEHTSWVRQLVYQPILDCFISSSTTSSDSIVLAWLGKVKKDTRVIKFPIEIGVNGFDYHERMCIIATAGINNHICLWNPYVTSKPMGILQGHVQIVIAVQFIGPNNQLLSFSKDGVLRVWDANHQICLQTLTGIFTSSIPLDFVMIFDKDHSLLLAACNHRLLLLKRRIEVKDRVVSHDLPVTDVVYNDRFNQIVSVCEGSCITIWLLSTGQKVKRIDNAHGDAEITAVCLDHSQTHILTGGTDGLIKRWDMGGHCCNILIADNGNPCEISKIVYLKRLILAFGWSKFICCFSSNQMNSFYVDPVGWKGGPHHSDDIITADFLSPKLLVTASYDGDIFFWNTITHNSCRKIEVPKKWKATSLPPISSLSPTPNLSKRRVRSTSTKRSFRKMKDGCDSNINKSPTSPLSSCSQTTDWSNVSSTQTVTAIHFLKTRNNLDPRTADLCSCHCDGYARFWNSLSCKMINEFKGFSHSGRIISCTDDDNMYLAIGDEFGSCKIVDISQYCLAVSSLSSSIIFLNDGSSRSTPIVLSSYRAHTQSISSIKLMKRKETVLLLTASIDCSIALYNLTTLIGIFGQNQHWDINNARFWDLTDKSIEEEEKLIGDVKESDENIGSPMNCLPPEDVPPYDEFRRNDSDAPHETLSEVWGSTVLGKAYQEERMKRNERKQPYELSSISTGIPTDQLMRSYRCLQTKCMDSVTLPEKPDFVTHPERYFFKEDEVVARASVTAANLKLRHDEKSIFPKYILDKMKSDRMSANQPSVFVRLSVFNKGLPEPKDTWSRVVKEAISESNIGSSSDDVNNF